MQDTRSIVIIGTKGVGKSALFRQLTKKYSVSLWKKNFSPIVNYTEELISIENNVYRLIDTPAFILSPQSEIEKGIRKQTDQLLEKCGLICWVIDQVEEKTLLLNKYLKKKSSPQILLLNKIDLEKHEESLSNLQILNPPYFFLISALGIVQKWLKSTTKFLKN